jgi:ubiquinone/menaquinone biosynthesis C-methylase UbiE
MTEMVLKQQVEYYRARATEYDEWFYRAGRYNHGEKLNQQWFEEMAAAQAHLLTLDHVESALELACGTGIWTRDLLTIAKHITAIDASPEMIEINRAKIASEHVKYIQADLFAWEPDQQYDLVFFSFWLSHVPPEMLDGFLTKVNRALKPGGILFLIDSRREPTSTASDHVLPQERQATQLTRKLNDGREFTIVKVFYEASELREHLENAGFSADVQVTPRYFIYADAVKTKAK